MDFSAAKAELERFAVQNPAQQFEKFARVVPVLLGWLAENGREYPWRATTDPWRVYISEILLQRTRADAVAKVYHPFFEQFPDPSAIRAENPDAIREVIAPLGLGSQRTKTLVGVAEFLETRDDNVPRSTEELQRPWGVGKYSARATMIFAFGEPRALVDTNFARIFERLFDIDFPTQPHKRASVYALLDTLAPQKPSLCRAYNLALLDIGALICTPDTPACGDCPLSSACTYPLPLPRESFVIS